MKRLSKDTITGLIIIALLSFFLISGIVWLVGEAYFGW